MVIYALTDEELDYRFCLEGDIFAISSLLHTIIGPFLRIYFWIRDRTGHYLKKGGGVN